MNVIYLLTSNSYIRLILFTFCAVLTFTHKFELYTMDEQDKPGGGFTNVTVSRVNSLLVLVFVWDVFKITNIENHQPYPVN